MKHHQTLLGAVALSLISSAALAADLPSRVAAPMAPVMAEAPWSWTGLYGGLRAGYGFGGDDAWGIRRGRRMLNDNAGEVGLRGGQFGLFAGYNWQFPGSQIVVGVEGDINAGQLSRSTSRASLSPFAASFSARSSADWNGSLRLRTGLAIDRALLYVTGGVAFLDSNYRGVVGNNAIVWRKSDTLVGYTVGAGFDYAITNNWFAGLEYRYTGIAKKTLLDTTGVFATQRTPSFHAVTARLGYKF